MTQIKRRKQIKFSRFVTWMTVSMASEAPIVQSKHKSKHTTGRQKYSIKTHLTDLEMNENNTEPKIQ